MWQQYYCHGCNGQWWCTMRLEFTFGDYLLAASSLWSVVRLCSCSTQQLVFQCIFQSRGWNATLGNDFICMVLARGCIRLCSSMHADEVKSMDKMCIWETGQPKKKIAFQTLMRPRFPSPRFLPYVQRLEVRDFSSPASMISKQDVLILL